MNIRVPLYGKILWWYLLNLLAVGAVFFLAVQLQFRSGLDSIFQTLAGNRMQAVSDLLAVEVQTASSTEWDAILRRYSQAYRAQFILLSNDGQSVAGEPMELPGEILAKFNPRRNQPIGRGPPPGRGPNRQAGWAPRPPAKFIAQTTGPERYWLGVPLPETVRDARHPGSLVLLAMATSRRGGGLFFDPVPWILFGFAVLAFSLLFWLPLVRSITRAIAQMTVVTERIAEGQLEARVSPQRKDELGRLGQAINRMADRLSGFVAGQKRFLGDSAHELCSPIARLQVALGILEQRADAQQKAQVADVREEVEQIAALVNEMMAFSKAGLQALPPKLKLVPLAALVRQVVNREAAGGSSVEVRIDDSLRVRAEPDLLIRALANLLRNAIRYAGEAGPISICAVRQDDQVVLSVADTGPGIPEDQCERIFDPFYRLEDSRSRETGGAGLGLAIVKTCLDACQATVTARNRQPSGLEIIIRFAPTEKT